MGNTISANASPPEIQLAGSSASSSSNLLVAASNLASVDVTSLINYQRSDNLLLDDLRAPLTLTQDNLDLINGLKTVVCDISDKLESNSTRDTNQRRPLQIARQRAMNDLSHFLGKFNQIDLGRLKAELKFDITEDKHKPFAIIIDATIDNMKIEEKYTADSIKDLQNSLNSINNYFSANVAGVIALNALTAVAFHAFKSNKNEQLILSTFGAAACAYATVAIFGLGQSAVGKISKLNEESQVQNNQRLFQQRTQTGFSDIQFINREYRKEPNNALPTSTTEQPLTSIRIQSDIAEMTPNQLALNKLFIRAKYLAVASIAGLGCGYWLYHLAKTSLSNDEMKPTNGIAPTPAS